MPEAIKNRWVLLLVLAVFIIVKIPALHYPFYWDESWSYAPAVKLMYLHGPSLMPNAIDLGYSRGHPLLFYASAATWMKIFGDSHAAQHSFSLFISCLLLITVYEAGLRLFNKRMAIISLLLVATQVIFFVQSTLLLPEVMVAWLSLLTLYCYSANKYLLTFISCTALMLTKESGFSLGLVLGIHATWQLFNKETAPADRLRNFASVAGAAVVTGLFFLLQKKLNGWYLFPEHTGLMDFHWDMFRGKLRYCIEIIFTHQYRSYIFGLLVLISVAAAIAQRSVSYAYPAILAIALFILGGEYYGFVTRRLFIPAVLALFIFTFHSLLKENGNDKKSRRFIVLSIYFIAAYLSFTCLNFFTNRYLFSAILMVLLLAGYCFDVMLDSFKRVIFYPFVAGILIIAFFAFRNNTGNGDVDLSIYNSMNVQEDVVSYLEQQQLYDHYISAHSPLQREHLTKPFTGFLHSSKVFTQVDYIIQPSTEFVIIDNIEIDASPDLNKLKTEFALIKRFEKGGIWAEIYKRK